MKLPVCTACGEIQYPVREICGSCLADEVSVQEVEATGILLSQVDLHHSLEPGFLKNLPWSVATVQIKGGAVMTAHLYGKISTGGEVELQWVTDPKGRKVIVAKSVGEGTVTWKNLENKGR